MIKFLGQTITYLREKQGYSLDKFANIVGVIKQTLIKWEHNASIPRLKHVVKVCEILHISIQTFLNLSKYNERWPKTKTPFRGVFYYSSVLVSRFALSAANTSCQNLTIASL